MSDRLARVGAGAARTIEVSTARGLARAHLHRSDAARGALILGHGAGGGIGAPDLQAATEMALAQQLSVVLVEQPYRVAGRRSPAPAGHLDEAWTSVAEHLRKRQLKGLELLTGGRSSGARVACRTAAATRAVGVLCLAFPLLPPARSKPPVSRLPELEAVTVPVLVVQGRNDRFGIPPAAPGRTVALVDGDHSLRGDREAVKQAIAAWLRTVL